MTTDLEIARAAKLLPIADIAARAGIPADALEPYGRYKAKVSLDFIAAQQARPDGALVLVTGISPTATGEGKTTTTIGLGDALNRVGKRTMICLREPSLGPCFGVKGGATGGGYAQVAPMDEINLHFTGDFHAITSANNLLAALVDNHLYWGNALGIDPRRVSWRRSLDMNDRALRSIVNGLGGPANGAPREDGFDITVASEVMAVFCLAKDLADLQERLGRIQVAARREGPAVTARDLQADGAMAALLRDAFAPNLVQTLEGSPALIHGGPFANIAHGCNSVMATRLGLKLADVVVTEAGFGADLGGEKFLDIKSRSAGLSPGCAVVVATLRALKMHGGVAKSDLTREDTEAVRRGLVNLARHVENLQKFGAAGGGGAEPVHVGHGGGVRGGAGGDRGLGGGDDSLPALVRRCGRGGRVGACRAAAIGCWHGAVSAALSIGHAVAGQNRDGGARDLPSVGRQHVGGGGKAVGRVRGGGVWAGAGVHRQNAV